MLKKFIFLLVLGAYSVCSAEDEQRLYVLDRKTNILYEAQYDSKKQMYMPVEAKEENMPSCDDAKSDIIDDETVKAFGQLRVPAIDDEKYIATYSPHAIIESDKFEDIFQVYACHIYQSCDHINGTVTGFDRGVEAYWAQKPVVFQAKMAIKNGKKDGVYEVYYDNGFIAESSTYQNGVENGPVIQYYPDGQFKWKGNYKDGKLNGLDQVFDENGVLRIETNYVDGVHSGEIKKYDEKGRLELKGRLKHKPVYEGEGFDEIYDGVVYDEDGKEIEKIKQGSLFRINYDDLNIKKLKLEK